MGWNPFESEKVTTVGTAIVRLVEDKNIVDSTKMGVINGLVSNEDVVDHILEATVNNVAAKATSAYRYAKSNSPYGMPVGTFYGNSTGLEAVEAALTEIESKEVFIEYCRLGPMNKMHLAWQTLISTQGYNPDTNKLGVLSTQKGKDVYLEDMVLAMPKAKYDSYTKFVLEVWNKPANAGGIPGYRIDHDVAYLPYKASPTVIRTEAEAVVVTYAYKTAVSYTGENSWNTYTTQEYTKDSFEFFLPAVEANSTYYQVKYVVNGMTKYWSYKVGSGTYLSIDSSVDSLGELNGEYFPNLYFRLKKTNPNNNKTSSTYKASEKYAKYLGINYSDLVDQIHDNPDITDVEQAFLTLGVPAETTDKVEIKYLYEYLDSQYQAITDPVGGKKFSPSKALMSFFDSSLQYTYSVEIKDTAFKMQFLHNGIFKRRVIGSVGAKGSYATEIENRTYSREVHYSYREISDGTYFVNIPYKVFKYKKQVGINFYDELSLIQPVVKYFIYGKYDNIVGDEDKELILVPIDKSIVDPFPAQEKEYLITRSMHLVFNSRVVTEVKWYQQGWFADLLQIAAIVITVYSLFTGNGAGLAIASALQAGMYAVAINLIVTGLVRYIVVTEVFKLFVKAAGVDAAFLLAIAAVVAGAYDQIKAETLKLTATAKDFLTLASGLVKAGGVVLQSEFNDLLGEFKELDLLKDTKLQELKAAEDLLSPTQLLQPLTLLGETPDSYYHRTVHSGNIGSAAIDDVHNFYQRSLMLPRYA